MATQSISSVVRAILSGNLDLSADEVIRRAKARGVRAPEKSIRTLAHNIKSDLKRGKMKPVPATATTAARQTQSPKPAATKKPVAPTPRPVPAKSTVSGDLSGVFANVSLVNKVVGVAGGVDQARKVAEAVRSCGGVDAFLQHLDLVAGIRTSGTSG